MNQYPPLDIVIIQTLKKFLTVMIQAQIIQTSKKFLTVMIQVQKTFRR